MRAMTILVLMVVCTVGLTAQTASTVTPKQTQIRQLEWQKVTLVAMADSMPEDLFRDEVTPEQRDFARQILHAAGFSNMVVARFFAETQLSPPDTASVLNSRAALTAFLTQAFDTSIETLENASEETRTSRQPFFGQGDPIPLAEFLDQAYLHAAFTIGQIVANFRKHGMAPPAFVFF
jgi:hypothetical protein